MSTFRGIQKKKKVSTKIQKGEGRELESISKAMNLTIQEGKRENREES